MICIRFGWVGLCIDRLKYVYNTLNIYFFHWPIVSLEYRKEMEKKKNQISLNQRASVKIYIYVSGMGENLEMNVLRQSAIVLCSAQMASINNSHANTDGRV